MFGDLHIDPKTGYTQTPQQRMSEIIEEVKLMDEIGLDFFGIREHHRPDYAVSSPEIILAALSTVTKNIKLGSAVSVISSTDLVKLYQDFASVDNLSNGRAEIMAGRGSFIESFPLFGYDLNDYDALFDEKLRLLLDLNKNEVINWRGKFRMPIINQSVYPKPVQEKLPIWIAVGGTKSSIVRAATLGLPIIFAIIGGNPADFNYLFEIYKQVYIENGHDINKMQIGVHMHSFFGEHGEKVAEEYFPIYGAQMNRIGASRGWPKYRKQQFDYGRSTNGHLIVGDASLAVDRILKYQEMFGLTRFSAHMDVGAPNHLDMMKSIEIFGKDILPKVKKVTK
ncbi:MULTISPECIES: LLM class flavin-dependent oxidoreductase [Empedobacter]|uniref:LLM class flavin-dependent oxidoreductase n=1 Tax=Empedobacter TaxID=59734 RepID=UPI0025C6BF07|nr:MULTISPECIES: LLM class flavin-dependent oxidoreductase [unclassified Empedobacter]